VDYEKAFDWVNWVKMKVLSGLEGLLEIVGCEVMAEGIRTGIHLEGWREKNSDCGSCNFETAGAKRWRKASIMELNPFCHELGGRGSKDDANPLIRVNTLCSI